MRYDIAVIGNDEAAMEMLRLAAACRRRTVAVLPDTRHSAWLMTQALRQLVLRLLADMTRERRTLMQHRGSPRLLRSLVRNAVADELSERIAGFASSCVDVVIGEATLTSSRDLQIVSGPNRMDSIQAEHVVIGTGVQRTALHRPMGLAPFQAPDVLFRGASLPEHVYILGGAEFGAGLAALMSLFGVQTHLITRGNNMSVMLELASQAGVNIGCHPADVGLRQIGSQFSQQQKYVIDCRRTRGFTENLGLEAIGVEPDEHGQLWCASNFETWCSGVFGIGDVVGFSTETSLHPSLQAERVMNRIIHSRSTMPDYFNRAVSA